ncbi:MAG TPA: FAD-dependent monooxygenase [Puia sp.]|jgi:2-polyprenyl-6-methoxyphenol hydroxylase-like FAD-dependent oxidoreductase
METIKQVPVLIVGGGISGLSAALFLLKQGITPMLIEKHNGTSIHPRSRGFDVRTMELYREIGLSEPIREAGKVLAPAWGIHTSSSLDAYLEKAKPKDNPESPIKFKGLESLVALTPEAGARCTQDLAEPILLQAARQRGAEILFNTELLSFSQNGHYTTAVIRNRETGTEYTIHADYIIAADGAKSSIRETLNVPTVGKGALGNLLNIYFEADLTQYVKKKEFSLLRIDEPDLKGLLASINNSDRWVFHLSYDPKTPLPSNEQVINILQKVIGLPGIKISILSVLPWNPTVRVVTEMQQDRIFLAGDSAHVMTPYGGKGANSGVQDVHNLCWKLGYVLKGKASPALLKTYSTERQPIGLRYAIASGEMANEYGLIKKVILKFYWAFISVMTISFLRLKRFFPNVAILQLGEILGLPAYRYYSTAVIQDEQHTGYVRSGPLMAQTGTRFPHFWIGEEDCRISTLDLLGKGFVLFTTSDNSPWALAAASINLTAYSLPGRESALAFKKEGAILVRPDGFVAWRCDNLPSSPTTVLQNAMTRILHNTPPHH